MRKKISTYKSFSKMFIAPFKGLIKKHLINLLWTMYNEYEDGIYNMR